MKKEGIIRRVDGLGRIVIPAEIRRRLGIDLDDPLEIYTDDGEIVLRPYDMGEQIEKPAKMLRQIIKDKMPPNAQQLIETIDHIEQLLKEG